MPVLSEEQSLYPKDLLDGDGTATGSDSQWWVLYTRSRQEKTVARHLLAHGVPFYVPLVKTAIVCRDRRLVAHVPLFPGYVFLFGSDDARVAGLTSNRVSRVLTVYDPERLRKDLQRIRALIESGAALTPESRLVPGKRVRIRHGTLAGLEGTLFKRQGQSRVLISVDFIQQGASVGIEDCYLELAD